MSNNATPDLNTRTVCFCVILGASLFAFIRTFHLLSPILLSFLLIVLISLAVNPLTARMRTMTGGRKITTVVKEV